MKSRGGGGDYGLPLVRNKPTSSFFLRSEPPCLCGRPSLPFLSFLYLLTSLPPYLLFSVHTSKFRIPQLFYLPARRGGPLLRKHPGVWGYSSHFGTCCEQDRGLTITLRNLRPMMPVVRRSGNSHAAKFILIILFMEDIPLLAAFEDFFFLRSDFLADFQFNLLFVFQRSRQDLHHLLPNGVAVVDKFHFLAVHQHVRDLVREPYDFFAGEAHLPFLDSVIASQRPSGSRPAEFPISILQFLISNLRVLIFRFPVSNFNFLVSSFLPLSQDQLAVPRQLLLHLFVHLLIRDAGPPHLVLMSDQNLAHFVVEPVFDRELFQHPQAHAVGHRRRRLRFDVPAFHQPLNDFSGDVRYKIPYEKHLRAFPLRKCKRVSLLAAPIKCKEGTKIAAFFFAVAAQHVAPCSAETANGESLLKPKPPPFAHIRARVDAFGRFLYDDLVSGIGRALSSAVRAFGLHPKGRPFKSDSAHHCDASPFSGDVVFVNACIMYPFL